MATSPRIISEPEVENSAPGDAPVDFDEILKRALGNKPIDPHAPLERKTKDAKLLAKLLEIENMLLASKKKRGL